MRSASVPALVALVLGLVPGVAWCESDKDILAGYGVIDSRGQFPGSLVPVDVTARSKGATAGTTWEVEVSFSALTFAVDEWHCGATGHDLYWPTNHKYPGQIPLSSTDPNWWGSNMYGAGATISVPVNGTYKIWFGVHYQHGTMEETYKVLEVQFTTQWETTWRPPLTVLPVIPSTGGIAYPQFPLMQVVPINTQTHEIEIQGDWCVGDATITGPGRVVEIWWPKNGTRRSQNYWNSPYYAGFSQERVRLTGVPSGVYDWELRLATYKNGSDTWWNASARCTIDWTKDPPIVNDGVWTPGTGGSGGTGGGTTGEEWADPPEAASDRLKALKDRFLALPPWGWVKQQGDLMTVGGQVAGSRTFSEEYTVPGLTWGVTEMQTLAPVRIPTGFGAWQLDAQGEGAGGDFAGVSTGAAYESKFRLMLRAALWSMFVVGLVAVAKGRIHV